MIEQPRDKFEFEPNYDEDKVPIFKVPNPLETFCGKRVNTIEEWEGRRRPELLDFFTHNVYGKVPCELRLSSFRVVEQSSSAIEGKAKRKQVELIFKGDKQTLFFNVLIYLPKNVSRAPVFMGYNFYGNHTVINDSKIIISDAWTVNNDSLGIINNKLDEQSRGVCASRWPVEAMIDAGFGLITLFYGEVDPDKNDMTDGIHPLLYTEEQQSPESNEWGSIAAWSWGFSRVMDYLEKDSDIDSSKVVLFGHSRLGKTSLWAGATDQRFAAVISNNSGCGGAALSKRKYGETIERINHRFPHWFCSNFKIYSDNEEQLPVDQHELLALIAPRPLYIASAEEDRWADPRGEYLSVYYATPVYSLYNKKGVDSINKPSVNQPIQNRLAYHIRRGKHDVTEYDWDEYIKWAKMQLLE